MSILKNSTRKLIGNKKPQLFYIFEEQPPSAIDCMSAVYNIFSHYPPARGRGNYCRTCASDEFVEIIVEACKSPSKAPASSFSGIYWEGPHCMGGISNIKFWLPRTVETYILTPVDNGIFTNIVERYQSIGLSLWPFDEQEVLRLTFCRALINFVESGNPAPLNGTLLTKSRDRCKELQQHADIFTIIIGMLIYLRIEPKGIFAYLKAHQNENIDFFLCREISDDFLSIDEEAYYDAETINNNDNLKLLTKLLNRRARTALFNAISIEDLFDKLDKYEKLGNTILCQYIEKALQDYNSQKSNNEDLNEDDDSLLLHKLLDTAL
ncbi:hypothetical protein [Bartonella sp. HY038]|uniref:hypothetical protein n=1 Tax=Bartonella sp. HY038 TaxID=2759660 RepID=UPI0015FCFA70|nr:hypothetical protein [Bartonella sp. HY038]